MTSLFADKKPASVSREQCGHMSDEVVMSIGHRIVVSLGILITSSAVYLHSVYIVLRSVDDLQLKSISFVISSICIGIICSCFPFRRPVLSTFALTAPAPVFSFFLAIIIQPAFAGNAEHGSLLLQLSLCVFFSLSFGILASFGCVIGLWLRSWINSVVNPFFAQGSVDAAVAKAASTKTQIVVAIIGAVGAIVGAALH